MTYTIIINKTESDLARNLLGYLKSLTQTKEYDFLQVIENEDNALSAEQMKELDHRYEHFLEHKPEYAEWEDVKQKYVKQ
jgi:hypothetical protein